MNQIFNAFYLSLFIKFLRTIVLRFSCNHTFKVIVPMGDDGYIVMATASNMAEASKMMRFLGEHKWSTMSVNEETDAVLATLSSSSIERFYPQWTTMYGKLPEYSVFDNIEEKFELKVNFAEELKTLALQLGQTPMTTVPKKFKRK